MSRPTAFLYVRLPNWHSAERFTAASMPRARLSVAGTPRCGSSSRPPAGGDLPRGSTASGGCRWPIGPRWNGPSPLVISRAIGRGSIAVTCDVYGHVLPHHDDELADTLDAIHAAAPSTRGATVRAIHVP
jgi:hypothetical protein